MQKKQNENIQNTLTKTLRQMKNLRFILLMVAIILAQSNLMANEQGQKAFETGSVLPSEQTQNQLEDLAIPTKIGTRQAPDEEGWAQKETPLEGVSFSIIMVLAMSCITYCYTKKTNLQKTKK